MDLDVIDGNHQTAAVFHLDGNDFTLLHDAMARLLEGLLQLRRNGIGNALQHVLVEGVAALGRHAEGLGLAVRRLAPASVTISQSSAGCGAATRSRSGNRCGGSFR